MSSDAGKLRAALAKLIDACGKVECNTPEILEMGQACLDAQRVMDEPDETSVVKGDKLPAWQTRHSKVQHHEGELTLAVYDAAGNTIARVQPCGSREQAERNTVLLAAAPEMCNMLQSACVVLRGFGDCIYPDCKGCNLGRLRRHHKLSEWQEFCDWVETLPMAIGLICGGKL